MRNQLSRVSLLSDSAKASIAAVSDVITPEQAVVPETAMTDAVRLLSFMTSLGCLNDNDCMNSFEDHIAVRIDYIVVHVPVGNAALSIYMYVQCLKQTNLST